MARTGIYTLDDLRQQRFTNANTFGLEKLSDSIQAHFDWLNEQINDQLGLFAETSEDARRVWGGDADFEMKEVDEYGEARSQKATHGVEVAFPLRKFSVTTGWTRDFLRRASVAELAESALGMQNAYLERMQDEIKFAIFNDDNYDYIDKFGDGTTLAVKAFLNADSAAIPTAPDGTAFTAASHKHYVGTIGASFAVADVDALISNVVEHGNTKGVKLFVPYAMIATLAGLSGTKFVAHTSAVLVPAYNAVATTTRLDTESDINNRSAGWWDGRVEVLTRSWMPATYIACVATGAAQKPLVRRVDKYVKGLVSTEEYGMLPLTAKSWEAYVGFGAYNRAAVAVLDTGHQTNYTEPTLVR